MLRALTPISLLLMLGCSAERMPVEIPFRAQFGDRVIGCHDEAPGYSLTDLRFYVYDIRLIQESGREAPLDLSIVPLWQSNDVALLDFENGQGRCVNGSAEVNTVVRGLAEPANYTGLRFRIGVPENLNHGDPLLAEPPLAYTSMHWHWLTGYRFLRAGVAGANDGFWLHLGSTRCEGTVADIKGCRASNRAEASLPGYDLARDTVIVDLQKLFADVRLEDGNPTSCSSGPAENACMEPFAALGIDFETGNEVAPASIFRLQPAK